MKYHLIFDKTGDFRGYTTNKEDLEGFKYQRDMNYFRVHTVHKKELSKDIIYNQLADKEALNLYGYIVFPEEELFMLEQFDQYYWDFMMTITYLLRDYKPFLKLSDDEYEKVEALFQILYTRLKDSEIQMQDEDEVFDYSKFFNMSKYTKSVVDQFGGRK